MQRKLLFLVSILIISSSVIPAFAYTIIPPTNAYTTIVTSNGTVKALNYSSVIHLKGLGSTIITSGSDSYVYITSSGGGGTGFGTYNTTLADNTIINSGGAKINFINSTNNPVHIVNDPTRNQVNVTIADTTGGGGSSPAPKVVINGNNRSSFSGIIANQTFPAPTVVINGNNRSSFIGVLNSTTFKANSITCINQFFSAYNNSTGLFTCSTPTATISINGLSRSTFTGIIANQTFPAPQISINSFNSSSHIIGATSPISISNSSSTHTISCSTCVTSVTGTGNNITSTGGTTPVINLGSDALTRNSKISALSDVAGGAANTQVLTFQSSNSTWVPSNAATGTITGSHNGGKSTGSVGVLAAATSTHIVGRNMTGTSPITITKTNDTDIAIACSTCLTTSSGGTVQTLASNLTSTSITSYKIIWTIPLTANSGNRISGTLVASTNTAGGAVQVGANVTNTHGQGTCTFSYASAATTGTFFSGVLSTTTTNSAWTTILSGANQPYPIDFDCTVNTDGTATSLDINFRAEVASTVSIKAGSSYIKTP